MFPCSRSEQQRSPATDGHTWSLQSTFASVRVHPRTSVHHQPWPLWSDTTLGLIVPLNSLSGARWRPAPSFIPLLALSLSLSLSYRSCFCNTRSATRPTGIAPGSGPATHCWPASGGFTGPSCQKTNCSTAWAFMNSALRSRAQENRLRKILGPRYPTLNRKSSFSEKLSLSR